MNCTGKISNMCGTKSYGVCVYYEGFIPDSSPLKEEQCINIQEAIEDLYNTQESIKENFDLEILRDECISYPTGTLSLLTVLRTQSEEICSLKASLSATEDIIAQMQQQIQDLQNNICNG